MIPNLLSRNLPLFLQIFAAVGTKTSHDFLLSTGLRLTRPRRVLPMVRLGLKFLLVNHAIVLKPTISMLAIRVAMSPMNNATLCIPFVHSVELDSIA
jgi:hypothetical protein